MPIRNGPPYYMVYMDQRINQMKIAGATISNVMRIQVNFDLREEG